MVCTIDTIAGIAGRESFAAILSNLLAILSYWTASFFVVVVQEHSIFVDPEECSVGFLNGTSTLSLSFKIAIVIQRRLREE